MKPKGRLIQIAVLFIVFTVLFSSCRFESVAEHESRLADAASALSEPVSEHTQPVGTVPAGDQPSAGESAANGGVSSPGAASAATTTTRAPNKPAGREPAATPTQPGADTPSKGENLPKTVSVTVSVTCKNAVGSNDLNAGIVLPPDGILLQSIQLTLSAGQSVFEALSAACKQQNLYFGYRSSSYGKYVERIGPIGEKDCGAKSGWTYTVDGVTPPLSADYYKLKKNAVIEWVFVTHI